MPPPGAITATADPVPRPPLWVLLDRLSLQRPLDGCPQANVQGKRGPAGPRHKAAPGRLRAPRRCPPPPPAACGPPRGR
jgi:hypothetical protein